jgi:Acetyltransferase (GNAT) domain
MSWSLRFWSESEFLDARAEWAALLARSRADPLFSSWDWLATWWRCHRQDFGLELRILAVYRDGTLCGLAPMHERNVRMRGVVRLRRRELLGNLWRDSRAVMSELVDFIVDSADEPAIVEQLAGALAADARWSDLVSTHGRRDGVAAACLQALALAPGTHLRDTDALPIYRIATDTDFAGYLLRLSASTRRRLMAQRKGSRLFSLEFATADSLADYLGTLGELLAARWGNPHFSGRRATLHREFATQMAGVGALRLSRLVVDGQVISILYNVVAGGREYNIQSAFQSGIPQLKSPGYLHLGYSLERAFADGLGSYELLAGFGRNTDYKAALARDRATISTIQLIRHPFWSRMYRTYDRLSARRGTSG